MDRVQGGRLKKWGGGGGWEGGRTKAGVRYNRIPDPAHRCHIKNVYLRVGF